MRSLSNGRIERHGTKPRLNARVALIPTSYGVNRIEDRDVNDRHGAARTARAELLAEGSGFTRRDGRVIEPARVDRDLVPAMHCIESELRSAGSGVLTCTKQRTERTSQAIGLSLRERRQTQRESEKQCWDTFHAKDSERKWMRR